MAMTIPGAEGAAPASGAPSFSAGREWAYMAHVLSQVLFLGLAVIGLVRLSYVYSKRIDLTSHEIGSLPGQTRQVLAGLQFGIEVYTLLDPRQQEGAFTEESISIIGSLVEEVLWKFRDQAPGRVQYEIVDVHLQTARVKAIQEAFGLSQKNRVLVVARDAEGVVYKKKELTLEDLAIPASYFSGKVFERFKGVEALTQAIRSVTIEEPVHVYWTRGHGEVDPDRDAADLKVLLEAEAYVFHTVDLRAAGKVPADCQVLVVAGKRTSKRFDPLEVAAIRDYLERKGDRWGPERGLLYAAEPSWTSGLEGVIREAGIEVHDDLVRIKDDVTQTIEIGNRTVQRQSGQGFVDSLIAFDEKLSSRHPATRDLRESGKVCVFVLPRSLAEARHASGATYESLVSTSSASWGWRRYRGGQPGSAPDEGDFEGPVDIAASSIKYYRDPSVDLAPYARVLAVGSLSILEDETIVLEANRQFAYATIVWLANRDPIILPPDPPGKWKAEFERTPLWRVMLPLFLVPAGMLVLGIVIGVIRRF